MYDYTDQVIKYLTKQIIRCFGRSKLSILSFDELHAMNHVDELYKELERIIFKGYWKIAEHSYKRNLSEDAQGSITKKWLRKKLNDYDPVMFYVFMRELQRKKSKYAEAMVAANGFKGSSGDVLKVAQTDAAMRSLSRMVNQFAIEVTDFAILKAYEDSGVEQVIWITEQDERRCSECAKLEGEIFELHEIPPKPHPNCRCRIYPYYGED